MTLSCDTEGAVQGHTRTRSQGSRAGQGRHPPELGSLVPLALVSPPCGSSVLQGLCILPVAFPVSPKRSDLPACSFSQKPLGSAEPMSTFLLVLLASPWSNQLWLRGRATMFTMVLVCSPGCGASSRNEQRPPGGSTDTGNCISVGDSFGKGDC